MCIELFQIWLLQELWFNCLLTVPACLMKWRALSTFKDSSLRALLDKLLRFVVYCYYIQGVAFWAYKYKSIVLEFSLFPLKFTNSNFLSHFVHHHVVHLRMKSFLSFVLIRILFKDADKLVLGYMLVFVYVNLMLSKLNFVEQVSVF